MLFKNMKKLLLLSFVLSIEIGNVIAMQQECKNESAALLAVDSNGYTALQFYLLL